MRQRRPRRNQDLPPRQLDALVRERLRHEPQSENRRRRHPRPTHRLLHLLLEVFPPAPARLVGNLPGRHDASRNAPRLHRGIDRHPRENPVPLAERDQGLPIRRLHAAGRERPRLEQVGPIEAECGVDGRLGLSRLPRRQRLESQQRQRPQQNQRRGPLAAARRDRQSRPENR